GGAPTLICSDGRGESLLLDLDQLNVKTERLQLADQHVERFRYARLDRGFALDDGFVDLRTAINVVGLRREQFLEDVSSAVSFERPHFHFSEALTTELRFAAQRLLGDKRVRTNRTCVDLVVDQVRKFEHVNVTNGYRLLELVTRHAVVQGGLAGGRQFRLFEQRLDLFLGRAVKHGRTEEDAVLHTLRDLQQHLVVKVGDIVHERRVLEELFEILADLACLGVLAHELGDLLAEFVTSPTKVGFQDLTDVHAAGHAEGVEDDLDWRSVFEVRHILVRQNAGDDTLVPVAAGHLIADAQFALHGDVNLHQLDYARWQFVALLQFVDLFANDLPQHIDLTRSHFFDLVDLLVDARIFVVV